LTRRSSPAQSAEQHSSQQPLGENESEEHDADDSVHREKRGVETGEIIGLHERVLVEQQQSSYGSPQVVKSPGAGTESSDRQRRKRCQVQHTGDAERVRLAKCRRNGIKSVLTIERD